MLKSTARVETATPERYAKQLVSHLGRKAGADELTSGGHRINLSTGTGVVRVDGSSLVMDASGPDEEALAGVEDVLARHLVRFATRDALEVVWSRVSG